MPWGLFAEKGEQEEEFETWLEKKKEAEEKEREEKQKQQASEYLQLVGVSMTCRSALLLCMNRAKSLLLLFHQFFRTRLPLCLHHFESAYVSLRDCNFFPRVRIFICMQESKRCLFWCAVAAAALTAILFRCRLLMMFKRCFCWRAVAAAALTAAQRLLLPICVTATSELNTPEGGLQRRKNKSDSSSSSSSSSSVMELDEEDAAIVQETKKMGYCYFRRDLTEEEKRLNAQNKPTKIASPTPSPQSAGAAGGEPEKVL